MNPVLTIAGKEIRDSLRNRWLLMISLILLVLSLCVSFGGSAISGSLDMPSVGSLLSGLVTLSVFLLPLAAILLSYDAFVGEEEAGTLLLMLTYPVTKLEMLLGKFLGHISLLAMACLLGFGPTVALLLVATKLPAAEVLQAFGHFIASGLLLAMVFILLGYLISLSVREKARALGALLFIWFLVVLIYDLALLATVVALADVLSRQTLNLMILANPADIFRALNLLTVDLGPQAGQSALAALSQTGLGLGSLYALMLCWVLALLAICQLRFVRKTL
ncbi:ABC transporter permease [Shewanella corallii]|uniref:ABC transporter permease n=1 Tax=Shewanella corallii TaxID=560080 RepID=A0ABT0N836_9GAMM|nr:ABC transporter permease [Shewanella corallii]